MNYWDPLGLDPCAKKSDWELFKDLLSAVGKQFREDLKNPAKHREALAGAILNGIPPAKGAQAANLAARQGGQKAAEEWAKRMARRVAKELGRNAREKLHNKKKCQRDQEGKRVDRTNDEYVEDLKDVYREFGKEPPSWLK